ncbi:nuclear transport factor 2 family protein [Paraburkholderia sp. HP33-1]|uniref:nuclear transport factor 2 family protein n=1 Tax=Paraburkholderia sp. HP33-1 TaxID=2883243 RepID=UPI001F23854D|nr:nuclear transport factor 2 family protein [Paraburkholderia sp. HP33-1]
MGNSELEVRIDQLEARIRQSSAFIEIMNLQARFNYYLEANQTDRIVDELFAQKDPLVRCEISDSGVYEGIDQIRAFWSARHEIQAERGYFGTIMLRTPHVRVNQDGNTAKGMWHAFGANSLFATPYPCDQEKLTAIWFMGKYSNEYVKEDGRWKIRSLRLIHYFYSPYEEGWIKQSDAYRIAPPPSVCRPNEPSALSYMYHPHGDNDFLRQIPEPD